MAKNVSYLDTEKIKLCFVSLIINVESVNRKFGTLHSFIKSYDLYGVTNGKLFVLAEMNSPPHYLLHWVREKLIPNSFRCGEDYIFVEEEKPVGYGERFPCNIDQPIAACSRVHWLESEITKYGSFVWYKAN